MTYTGFRFPGANAVPTRPPAKVQSVSGDVWAKDKSSAEASDGTELDATWANRVKAALERTVVALGGNLGDGDEQIANAIVAYVATAIATRAAIASPEFIGIPKAPTAALGTNTLQIANMAALKSAIDDLKSTMLGGAPAAALDTLLELGNALNNDPNFATTILTAVGARLEKTQNLADLNDASAARSNLGLVSIAASGSASDLSAGTIPAARIDASVLAAVAFGTMTDLASDATTDLGSVNTVGVNITGTTPITSLGSGANLLRFVRFEGSLTLTYNAPSLKLPTAADVTTATNDTAIFLSDASGNWTCLTYQRADGTALVASSLTIASTAEAEAGTDNTKVMSPLRTAEAIAALAETYFESSEITLGSSTQVLSASHGLGNSPRRWQAAVRCKTAELGYSVGDEVDVTMNGYYNWYSYFTGVDDTQITWMSAGATYLANKSSGSAATITPANWKLVLRAWL